MKAKITYITGGERSGKSSYGQDMALKLSDNPVYLATAQIMDADFGNRVKRHQNDRDNRWETIEEPMHISNLELTGRVVLLDCITLWLYNYYYASDKKLNISLDLAKAEWRRFINKEFNLIVISNEMGMGVHGITEETRKFVELQGWMNQFIAQQADTAWMMVSGLPLKLK